jgi:hypothetical protein
VTLESKRMLPTPTDPPPPPGRRRAYWACQLGGWGLVSTLSFFLALAQGMPQRRATVEMTLVAALGIGLTHLFRRFIRAHDWQARSAGALIPRVLAAALLLATAMVLLLLPVERFGYHDPQPQLALLILSAILRWALIYIIWSIFYFDIQMRLQRQATELQQLRLGEALRAAELRALKSQLNPHFLFNSLNSVRALIADDPTGAQAAVTQLARMLRYSLSAQEELVSLERELEIVEDYLALETLRLGDRLTISRSIGAGAGHARIPVMLLQTLVENAIKHGIAPLPAGGTLVLSATLDEGALTIVVEHPCPTHEPEEPEKPARPDSGDDDTGIGLANAARRLTLLFGDRAKLQLDLAQPGRATARVHIGRQP